jgi:hypothetical protein
MLHEKEINNRETMILKLKNTLKKQAHEMEEKDLEFQKLKNKLESKINELYKKYSDNENDTKEKDKAIGIINKEFKEIQ